MSTILANLESLQERVLAGRLQIDHEWMLMFLGHRIAGRRLLGLICKWLQAGVMEDGRRVAATKGTPQGVVITPRTILHTFFSGAGVI